MRIFFTASISGREHYLWEYRQITKTLTEMGHLVKAGKLLDDDISSYEKEKPDDYRNVYKALSSNISCSDITVAEVSQPSISVGYQISEALEEEKPVIVLHKKGKNVRLLEGNPNEKLQVIGYDDKTNFKDVLSRAVEVAMSHLDIRFNFFITPPMIAYMDWLSEKKRIPRSVYLRGLIEKEMRANKEYQKEISGNGDK